MDQISISPIVLLIVLLLTLAALGVAVFFSMRYKQFKDDLNEYCPEAETFIRGRKERKPVLAIHDSGSTYTRFLLGETENRASWTFKCEEFEVKFRPDFSSHCEADRFYGDLEVFHAAAHHPHFLSSKSVMAINNLVDLLAMDKFEKLRFLRTEDLSSLMKMNAQDLPADCQMFLKEYSKKDVGQILPKTVDEFVRLIQEAVKCFEQMALEGSGDTPDSVYLDIVQTIKEKPSLPKPKNIFNRLMKKDDEETEEEESGPSFVKGIRQIWKLKGFSYKYAFIASPIATTSKDVENMENLSREQGKKEQNGVNDNFFRWVIAIIAVLGVVIFGVVVLVNVL